MSLHHVAVPAQPWPSLEAALLPRLPPGKRSAIERLRFPADRNASMLGLLLLEAGCRDRGTPVVLGRLEYPPKGKPTLPGGPYFSIAHTRGRVGVALCAEHDVGFDVERANAASVAALRLSLTEPARGWLVSGAVEATRLWVSTEAVLKGAGLGIASAARIRFLEPESALLADRHWRIGRVDLGATFEAAVACDGAHPEVRVQEHLPEALFGLPFGR